MYGFISHFPYILCLKTFISHIIVIFKNRMQTSKILLFYLLIEIQAMLGPGVERGDQLGGIGFPLLPCGYQVTNLSIQAWQKVPSIVEPFQFLFP